MAKRIEKGRIASSNNKDVFLREINEQDEERVKEYKKLTTGDQHHVVVGEQFSRTTEKITKELAEMANIAVKGRIDALAKYTKDRIDKINLSYFDYEGEKKDNNADSDRKEMSLFNSVEDWIDDLYLIFSNLDDTMTIGGSTNVLDNILIRKLPVEESDDTKQKAPFRSLLRKVQQLFGTNVFVEEEPFYFKTSSLVKAVMVELLKRSGFRENLEEFLFKGINSGEFCFKESWETTRTFKLSEHETEVDNKIGNFKHEIVERSAYKFKVPDTRNLIFRPDSRDCITEIIRDKKFSDLFAMAMDEDGNQREGSPYDLERLKEAVKFFIKDEPRESNLVKGDANSNSENDDFDLSDIYSFDGDVLLYQTQHLPLERELKDKNGKKVKKIVKSIVVQIILPSGKLWPIRIAESSFVNINYHFAPHFKKDKDLSGMSLSELLRDYSDYLRDFKQSIDDTVAMAASGITFIDKTKLENPEQVEFLRAKDVVGVKNLKGASIDSVIQWLQGNVSGLPGVINHIDALKNEMKVTARKGPTGEKLSPNPTATEASVIFQELEKSVNRVSLRLNDMFKIMLKNMYTYTALNSTEELKIKVKGFRVIDKNKTDENGVPINADEPQLKETEKTISLTYKDIFVDGLDFEVKAAEKAQRQAVEKQQSMQFLELLTTLGFFTDQPQADGSLKRKEVIDDAGNPVQVDQFKMLEGLALKLEQKIFWKKSQTNNVLEQPATNTGTGLPQSTVGLKKPSPGSPTGPNPFK